MSHLQCRAACSPRGICRVDDANNKTQMPQRKILKRPFRPEQTRHNSVGSADVATTWSRRRRASRQSTLRGRPETVSRRVRPPRARLGDRGLPLTAIFRSLCFSVRQGCREVSLTRYATGVKFAGRVRPHSMCTVALAEAGTSNRKSKCKTSTGSDVRIRRVKFRAHSSSA